MNKAVKFLDKVISTILIVLVAFLAVGVSVTIVLRYFFGISFAALEEFLTMSFIFITLFGSAIAIREKQHISISFLADKIVGNSPKRKRISTILIDVAIIFCCAVMVAYSCRCSSGPSAVPELPSAHEGFLHLHAHNLLPDHHLLCHRRSGAVSPNRPTGRRLQHRR